MRTIDATLTSALAAGTGIPYTIGYIGYDDGTIIHSAPVTRYKLTGSTLEFEMPYTADIAGDQQCIWLERGLTLAGTDYTVTTGRFRIHSQRYLPNGHQVAAGALFPKQYYADVGDTTYKSVIDAFCATFGKTAVYRDPAAAWLDYQFFPAGKSIILNDANRFANLLAQKYLIFLCDNGSEEVLVYSCAGSLNVQPDLTLAPINDFFRDRSARTNRCLIWRDENGSIHTAGDAADPLHNLGYLESTATAPARRSAPFLFEARIRPDLRVMDGDVVQVSHGGAAFSGFALVTEEYVAGEPPASAAHSSSMRSRRNQPRWHTIIASNEVFANTEGGAMPSTIERVSNYTPVNTSQFNGALSGADNNLQAALDTLDDHTHPDAGGGGYTIEAAAPSFSPADAATYYFGAPVAEVPTTADGRYRLYIPRAGTVTAVAVCWSVIGGTAGSAQNVTANLRRNASESTLIQTVGNTLANKQFVNYAMDVAVSQGDFLEIEIVCPTWTTNPTLVRLSAVIYIST